MTGIDPNSKTSAAKTMQLFSGFVSEHVSLCLLYASNVQGSFHTSLPCLASLFAYNACREHKLSIETAAPALVQGKDWLVPRRTLGMAWQARLIMSNQLHSSAPLQQKKILENQVLLKMRPFRAVKLVPVTGSGIETSNVLFLFVICTGRPAQLGWI